MSHTPYSKSVKRRSFKRSTSIAALMALAPMVTFAAEETEDKPLFDEIIVTSTKRAESIQTVGLSVTALQGEDLQQRGAVDFVDYAISIPNLSFGATNDGVIANRSITIRGIQGVNTTGFYIDDVPLEETVNPLVLDVERVEVLRGPQGTLFGARGLGGTIRIITKQPDFDEVSGSFHTTISATKEGGVNYLVDGVANLPLSDNFAARITAYYQHEEGIFDKIVGPSNAPGVGVDMGAAGALIGDPAQTFENVDDKETYGAQLALRLDASDELSISGRILYQKTELSGYPLADFAVGAATGDLVLNAEDFTQERLFNVDEGGEDEWVQFSLNITYETDFGTFTSSSGYFTRDVLDFEDTSEFISFTLLGLFLSGDFGTVPTAVSSPIFQQLEFDTFVEEIRFVSDFDGPFQMTVGAFYQTTDQLEAFMPANFAAGFGDILSGPFEAVTGMPFTTGDLIFESFTPTEIEEFGLFGEFTYNITEQLSATFGVRYFDTEVTTSDVQSGFVVGGFNVATPEGVQSEDGFNFKGLIEYEATDDIFLYASVAEGFRIGGTNPALPNTLECLDQAASLGISPQESQQFNSDSLISYEVGTKTSWNDGALQINAAAFYIEFDDIQQLILLPCGFDFTENLGSATSKGFELEISAYPTDGLFLQLAAGYTDSEFTETVAGVVNEGDALQQVPEWTFSATVDYETPVSFKDYALFTRVDFSHVGSSISTVVAADRDAGVRIRPSYSIVNTRIGLRNEQYEVGVFVNNLFNEDAVFSDNRTLAAEAAGRPRIVRNRPRTIGIDLRARF